MRFSIVVPGVPCEDSEVLGIPLLGSSIPCLEIHPIHSPLTQGHPSGRSQISSENAEKGMRTACRKSISERYFNLEESQK